MEATFSIPCSQCRAQLHPTGRATSVRCEYCGADNLIDPAVAAQIAARGPVAPPDLQERVERALEAVRSDPGKLMDALAQRLTAALPDQVQTEKGGLFSSHLSKIAAQLGDWRYEIERHGQKVNFVRTHAVRGIALKRTELTWTDFTRSLAAELYELSREQQPRALEKFLGAR